MALAFLWARHFVGVITPLVLFVVHLLIAVRAITRPNRTPSSRIAWVAVVMFLPILGILAYLFLGETSIGRERIRQLRATRKRMALPDDARGSAAAPSRHAAPLFDLGQSINGFRPVGGNRIALMDDSNAAIDSLVDDINHASDHVHIGFYIWLDDHNGGKVADAVAAAARRGVHCRVMLDALGSRMFIHSPRWQQLGDAGVRLVATLDDVPRIGKFAVGRVDLRNHRKIVVIDNRIAYCGSQNCADPEFRIKPRFAPWVDMFLRCEGPVVRQQQYLFLNTWIAETADALEQLPAAEPEPECFDPGAMAQIFGTGPTTRHTAMSDMFVACMYAAHQELLITTPYFVPDEAIEHALCAAPRRGVKTTIIFPARNDVWLAGSACRSTYYDLLECGVAIYEYDPGLLHSKSMTIDGEIALVGSANLDRRSLDLNYENNLLIDERATVATIRRRQVEYLGDSHAVTIDAVRAWPSWARLVQNTVGMISPVL
jgi:cardiolipin synthase